MAPHGPTARGEEIVTTPLLSSEFLDSADLEDGDGHPRGLLNGCTDRSHTGQNGAEYGHELEGPSLADTYGMGAMPSSYPILGGETFGATREKFESLDYEIAETKVYKDDWRSRTPAERSQYIFLKWVFVLVIGVCTGLASFGINMAVENLAGLKFQAVLFFMTGGRPIVGCVLYALVNVVLVCGASMLCVFVAPAAIGSGIPEVKAFLNGVDSPNVLAPATLLVKIIGSIGSVGGGLAVGKEGPLVHTGACIAALLGQGGSKKYKLDWKWLRFFKNDRDRRDLVTCGAAAGVASAFRAPVGGVLFALEEATSWWRGPLLWRAFFTNAVVAVTLRTLMSLCRGGVCGLYSEGGFVIFDEFHKEPTYGLLELLPVTVLGITGGLLGSLFNAANLWVCKQRRKRLGNASPWWKVLEACSIALLTSVVQFSVPWTAHCKPCPTGALNCPQKGRIGNYKMFNCPEGHFNDLATLLFNTNDDSIRNLFSAGTDREFSYHSLLIFLLCFYCLSILTYGIAVPSGLFVPSILSGASYGRMVGRAMATMFGPNRVNEGTYALLGAASFLGGSTRMTVSICVILLELTGDLAMLPLIMFVLLIAKTVGDSFNAAIYDTHLKLKEVPLLGAHPKQFMKQYTAIDAVANEPVCFRGVERVGTIYDVLRATTHNAFPVVDEPGAGTVDGGGDRDGGGVYGLVLRSHLLVLLKMKKVFQASDAACCVAEEDYAGYSSMFDFGKPGTGKGLTVRDVELSEEEMEMYLDLHPFANTSPYSVSEGMALDKAYTLFRQLGLRHLCVITKAPRILGLLTRKDLLPESFARRVEEKKNLPDATSVSYM